MQSGQLCVMLYGVVAAASIIATTRAQAMDDKSFACMTMQYWLSRNAIEERDVFNDISEKCSLSDEQMDEVGEFVETVEAVSYGGGREFLQGVYGPARAKLFEDVTRETIRVIEISNANLMKRMPIP